MAPPNPANAAFFSRFRLVMCDPDLFIISVLNNYRFTVEAFLVRIYIAESS